MDLGLLNFKYVMNIIDMRQTNPWEAKSSYIFFAELISGKLPFKYSYVISKIVLLDFIKVSLYLSFFAAIVVHYGLPLHILRDLFMTIRSFLMKLKDWIQYRRAMKILNEK